MIKTIIKQKKGIYSAFPTAVTHGDRIFVFFRQGSSDENSPHGGEGRVVKYEADLDEFMNLLNNDIKDNLEDIGSQSVVFENGNEMDAILSDYGDGIFSLATRSYEIRGMETFISFSDSPVFKDRSKVNIKGVQWLAFYGKGFKWEGYTICTAYGCLKNETWGRPLVLITDDYIKWEILSWLPSSKDCILNESSVVFDGSRYSIYMRRDNASFGIWKSSSADLQKWLEPEELFPMAQAPSAFMWHNRPFFTFREIVDGDNASVSLYDVEHDKISSLDKYFGNIYDGGYSDCLMLNSQPVIFYYLGNHQREPEIRCIII